VSQALTDIDRLADAYWDASLQADPTQGTVYGERRYDDRLPDISVEGRAATVARFEELLAAARSTPEPDDHESALTRLALISETEARLANLAADAVAYTVDAMNGPQAAFMDIPGYQPLQTAAEAAAMLARWRAMGPWLDELVSQLRRGMGEGRTPVAGSVRRVVTQLEALLARPDTDWPLLDPLRSPAAAALGAQWAADMQAAVRDGVRPAFARYRDFLVAEALPAARGEERVGICHLPGGTAAYVQLARAHTSLDTAPEEIHAIGLAEIARIDAEITELGGRVLGTRGLPETLAALRADPSVHFGDGDEIFAVAERSLERANAAIPAWFGRLPQARCEVVRMLPHESEHATIAYYREAPMDRSRPGRYFINTSAPTTRPRYEAEALAFHESVPGHHLQIAIGQELEHLPVFRRHGETTAFIEGWGLYSERLANEMGLYSGDLDRIGMLSYDAWRASRLVVDTGMHALGWPRSRAIEFMTAHTALAPNNIANEVDRYIGWPGQALGYKLGQLQIRALRDEAQAALGPAFDVRAFHDAVLGHGALPLDVLRDSVRLDLGL
jgi:uncharacterized protein (DUF885 family)